MLVAIVAVALWLWWPRYDLEVALNPGPSNYQIVEENFYTLSACRKAAGNYRGYDWIALKWNGWGKLFNKYSKYDSKHR